jgi:hypothetical protein
MPNGYLKKLFVPFVAVPVFLKPDFQRAEQLIALLGRQLLLCAGKATQGHLKAC